MADARNFIIAASRQSDDELAPMMRSAMLDEPSAERPHWLRKTELALDGYGDEQYANSAERLVTILQMLKVEQQADVNLVGHVTAQCAFALAGALTQGFI